jgi:hypothetical protein
MFSDKSQDRRRRETFSFSRLCGSIRYSSAYCSLERGAHIKIA